MPFSYGINSIINNIGPYLVHLTPIERGQWVKTVKINPLEVKTGDYRYVVNALRNIYRDSWGLTEIS